jgi:hypothetical protein
MHSVCCRRILHSFQRTNVAQQASRTSELETG